MPFTSSIAFSTHVFPLVKSSSSILLPRLKFFPSPLRPYSSTPYPLYYELIHYSPVGRHPRRYPKSPSSSSAASISESNFDPSSSSPGELPVYSESMDRAKRRYYRKRQKRMYGESGSDSDSVHRPADQDFVELKPEIVDFHRLHAREQELYFYDAFALPWEKEKHYRMVYQLEKKYFPEYSLDKAFLDPAKPPLPEQLAEAAWQRKKGKMSTKNNENEERDERALMFFDEEKGKEEKRKDGGGDVSEKKVEEFFKFLKKVPVAHGRRDVANPDDSGEPFFSSRRLGLPVRWDGPSGTVVLVDKPKGHHPLLVIFSFL